MKNALMTAGVACMGAIALQTSWIEPAKAAVVTYDFTVDIDKGPQTGNQFFGQLTYDTDDILSDPNSTDLYVSSKNSLKFQFDFTSVTGAILTEKDDIDYANPNSPFPLLNLRSDGSILGLEYLSIGTNNLGDPVGFGFTLNPSRESIITRWGIGQGITVDPNGGLSLDFSQALPVGTISYTQTNPAAVPEPTTMLGSGVAAGMLAWKKRRQTKSEKAASV